MPLTLPLSAETLSALATSAEYTPDRASALAILLSPAFVHDVRVWTHLHAATDGLPFDDILGEGWSRSERLLLKLAYSLYNGGTEINAGDIMATLDDAQLDIAISAIRAYRHADRPVPRQAFRRRRPTAAEQ